MTCTVSHDDLRKALELELSLENSDIRSHGWFHGIIQRQKSEELVKNDGDFLVRDCSSRPGDFVLTCKWKKAILHFVISKIILQPHTVYERIQFTFEEDSFDTVPDLITFYVGNRRPISKNSGAIISSPINRCLPLSQYALKYNNSFSNVNSLTRSPKHKRRSCSSLSKYQSGQALYTRYQREQLNSDDSETSLIDDPPPKPNRFLLEDKVKLNSTEDDSKEANYTSEPVYVNKTINEDQNGDGSLISEDSAFFSDSSPKENDRITLPQKKLEIPLLSLPQHTIPSTFPTRIDPQNFPTFLLPKDNKPLDPSAVIKIRNVFLESGPRILANHMTHVDLSFIEHTRKADFGLGVLSGLEFLTLPQGTQYRKDLLEKHECFKLFVAITILTCHNEVERAAILCKWIQIAIEAKTALGNLNGFASIMSGLLLPQISRLRETWMLLRQNYTKEAFTFEAKLRPTLKSMNECAEPQPPNTTFPYVIPLVEILQSHYDIMKNFEVSKESDQKSVFSLKTQFELSWESSATDYGLQLLFSHLESGRNVVSQSNLFKRNGEIVFDGVVFEELLLDMFKPEFHRRFMWGFKGCVVLPEERYLKFNQVLKLLSQKCESYE